MKTDFKYKSEDYSVVEKEEGYSIRIGNKYGFTWFATKDSNGMYLKVKKASEISKEIQEKPFGKYAFMVPIWL